MGTRAGIAAVIVALLVIVLARDAVAPGDGRRAALSGSPIRPAWTEVKWPFPLDQWGVGRAFVCRAADCGSEVNLYLRPKLGFCNCATGVSDDAELDRVGDLELLSPEFNGLREGQPIAVGQMNGRSRPYQVAMRFGAPRTFALAIAFNDKCDVVVTTVVAQRSDLAAAERAAIDFLNSDDVLRWAERELGL